MKKNRMMRLASGLLVLCLLTTCTISSTFAKYVTSASASDTARVAKFGVVVTATGSLYDKNYMDVTNGNTPAGAASTNLTVSSDTDNLVAPGTKNVDGMTFSITGKPEVAVKLDVVVTDSADIGVKDVFLKANTGLPDMTTGNKTDTFVNDADYYPIKYTLKHGGATLVDGGKLTDVKTKLEELTNGSIPANTDLETQYGTYTLTWAWDFDNSGSGTYDKQDTLLGDLAAGTTLTPATTLVDGTDYNLKSSVKISITVTQVD